MANDIFQILGIENKEDKYTFCFCEFFKYDIFRSKVAEYFCVDKNELICVRETFNLQSITIDGKRKKITPDIVLFNNDTIIVLESKMFANEGYYQTLDYECSEDIIKEQIYNRYKKQPKQIKYYFFTLAGLSAKSSSFETITWADFYFKTLSGLSFSNQYLDALRDSICFQAEQYLSFVKNINEKLYTDLFSDDTYWVRPYSLFSSGNLNKVFNIGSGYNISHGTVTGMGHADFVTNIDRDEWWIKGCGTCDNLHLFIRIHWNSSGPVVWLGWEYFNPVSYKYYPTSKITPKEFRTKAIEYLKEYKNSYMSKCNCETTQQRDDAIKVLKCTFSNEKPIIDIINDIKRIFEHYENEIKKIIAALSVDDYLCFSSEKYKRLSVQE